MIEELVPCLKFGISCDCLILCQVYELWNGKNSDWFKECVIN